MELQELQTTYAQAGHIEGICVRTKRLEPVKTLPSVMAIEGKGLEGDRYNGTGGTRQVTLIQKEHLAVVAAFLGKQSLDFEIFRRNILVSGINLLALKGKSFRIGDAVLQHSGECHPCSRMEQALGRGGYNAMRGHGGITARVLESGVIRVGDTISYLSM